ncbi:hypothetical protein SNE510_44250 [Streptomyces sp. NE5-10]|uniref:hypothetical protein n=1 Tax=Streptomyces sp. NE5-10 TaxID=2759674 RepID=UPI0019068AF9|nr:hypothetical protein [Streptomyces sp. NE5-10]GHJ94906.1 hypothetical protein SNE510_44250 [Streptomyces sp. NE5-10]
MQPLRAASADPGFVPGLTGTTDAPRDAVRDAVPDEASGEATELVGSDADASDASDAPDASEGQDAAEDEAGPADGPVFEAADRRGRIVADAEGVRLSYDEEACEFRWDELAAVESAKGRFGKRFTVTVHTPDRRWYPIDLLAPDRGRIAAWEAELDAVLDAYFDDEAS